MKRTLLFALSLLAVVACSKFDDSAIWEELNKHEDRIVKLETLCNQMNTNIASLQTIIIALQSNDYVVNIAPIKEGNKEIGYTITFSKSGSITIYHGKDGENGKDGVNGADGEDGYTPKIGVKQHTDGKYYWTLDGNWLLDDSGNMIPTTGEDGQDGVNGADGKDGQDGTNGKDGQDGKDGEDGQDGANGIDGKDGKDGITPQLKIEDGYWYLSYDNGTTWQKLGKATGNNGLDGADGADGEDGDSIIDSITQDDANVYFNLSDGTVITLMKRNSTTIDFRDLYVEAVCVRNWDTDGDGELSYNEAANVISLGSAFKENTNIISFDELKFFTGLTEISTEAFLGCSSLWRITIPENVQIIESKAFYECINLDIINMQNATKLKKIGGGWNEVTNPSSVKIYGAFAYCTSLKKINLPKSIESIEISAFAYCSSLEEIDFGENTSLKAIEGAFKKPTSSYSVGYAGVFMHCTSLKSVTIPQNVTEIGACAFYGCSSLKSVTFDPQSKLNTINGGYHRHDSSTISYGNFMGAFTNCSSLETIVLPESLKYIGNCAFYNCTSLSAVILNSPTPPEMDCTSDRYPQNTSYHFKQTSASLTISVPAASLNTYKATTGWVNYSSVIVEL